MGNTIIKDKSDKVLYNTIKNWGLSEYDEGLRYKNDLNSQEYNNLLIKRILCLGGFVNNTTTQVLKISLPFLNSNNIFDISTFDIEITKDIIEQYNSLKSDYQNNNYNTSGASAPSKCINLYNNYCNKIKTDRKNTQTIFKDDIHYAYGYDDNNKNVNSDCNCKLSLFLDETKDNLFEIYDKNTNSLLPYDKEQMAQSFDQKCATGGVHFNDTVKKFTNACFNSIKTSDLNERGTNDIITQQQSCSFTNNKPNSPSLTSSSVVPPLPIIPPSKNTSNTYIYIIIVIITIIFILLFIQNLLV